MAEPDWTTLQEDLLQLIAKRLPTVDLLRFGKVCPSWRSAAHNCNRKMCIPWLMLAGKRRGGTRKFFNFLTGAWGVPLKKMQMPQLERKRCLSSRGWVMAIGRDWSINLVNPLSGETIQLPGIDKIKSYKEGEYNYRHSRMFSDFIHKFVISEDPSLPGGRLNYIVMVLCGIRGDMAFWQPGDQVWTLIEDPNRNHPRLRYPANKDILHYKDGMFISIGALGAVVICDVHGGGGGQPKIDVISQIPREMMRPENLYIVKFDEEGSDEFFVMDRFGQYVDDNGEYGTYAFDIIAFDLETRQWREVVGV